MKAIYQKRLLKLAALLLADAKNKKGVKFDLACVTSAQFDPQKGNFGKIEVSCGTTACAMGLAAISDAFKREGVGWKQVGRDIEMWIIVKNRRKRGWGTVAQRLFGLHEYEVDWLFTNDGYIDDGLPTTEAEGERAVAERLKDFANGKIFAPIPNSLIDKGRWAPDHA